MGGDILRVRAIDRRGDAFIGIDPGKGGAWAAISKKREIIILENFSDFHLISNMITWIKRRYTPYASIERNASRPKQSIVATFNHGTHYGTWLGILIANAIPYTDPTPHMWQRGRISKADGSDIKRASVKAAQKMWPKAKLLGPRGGILHGRSDALHIADYCRKEILGR